MVSSPFLDIYCHKIHVVISIGSQKLIETTLTPPLVWMQLMNLHPQILREADFAPTEFSEKLILLLDFHTKAPFIFRVSFWSTYENLHPPFQNPNMDLIGVDTRGERLNLNLLILRKADFILLFFIHEPFSSSVFWSQFENLHLKCLNSKKDLVEFQHILHFKLKNVQINLNNTIIVHNRASNCWFLSIY